MVSGVQSIIERLHARSRENIPGLNVQVHGTGIYQNTTGHILADGCETTAIYQRLSMFWLRRQQQMVHGFHPLVLSRRRRRYLNMCVAISQSGLGNLSPTHRYGTFSTVLLRVGTTIAFYLREKTTYHIKVPDTFLAKIWQS